MTKTLTLYEELYKAGAKIDHHESDLLFKLTPATMRILQRYPTEFNRATTFVCQVSGSVWYEVPFAFDPFYSLR